MSDYWVRTQKDIEDTRRKVSRSVAVEGLSPVEAINRNAHTAESYSAMLKDYGLKPDIPD